ncbi:hypothetical protein [Saccharothrix sp. ALI-22-I]|uniref:hypothetical protein n=1 Tax=Saccharothrix sp. ALI-22-I TaxID=1933778 RepID=UPI0015C33DA1|nr:hypothetical protein [Saccharothrix sp. ALI-22-I]
MSSTPIYDELAATYLADLTPENREPAGSDQPTQPASPPTAPTPPRNQPRKRPKV